MESGNFSHVAMFDGQAAADLALRAMLGTAGLSKPNIDELMSKVDSDGAVRGEIAELMNQSDVSSQKFALTMGAFIRLACKHFLVLVGCPESALDTNADYILSAAQLRPLVTKLEMKDDEG